MFELRMTDGKIFKQIIEAIKDLVNDGNLDCSPEELSIQCMDSSHVALVAMSLTADAFDHYRCDRPVSLGFNSANLSKVLKLMKSDDTLVLKHDEDSDVMSMVFENAKTEGISDFEFKLMEVDSEALQIPDTEYKSVITMPADEFQRIIRDLQVIGEACTISTSKEGVKFAVAGDIGSGSVLVRSNPGDDKGNGKVEINLLEAVELNFALRYLNFFAKATPLSGEVILSLSPDLPMVVDYPIGEAGKLAFYLAPKIDENEDN